jgi:hypothetical protein
MNWRRLPRLTLALLAERQKLSSARQGDVGGPLDLGTTEDNVRRHVEGRK